MSKTCNECGHPMDDNALVCPECGCPAPPPVQPVEAPVPPVPPVNNVPPAGTVPPVNNNYVNNSEQPEGTNKLWTILFAALCVYAVLRLFCDTLCIVKGYWNINFYNVVGLLGELSIVISAIICFKNKKAIWGLVAGFALFTIANIYTIGALVMSPSNYSYSSSNDSSSTTEYADSADVEDETVSASGTESTNTDGNQYTYEFVVSESTYRLTFNKFEKTAKLEVDGHTFYGTCEHDGLYRPCQIHVTGFDGADDYDIHKGNSSCSWSGFGPWVDYEKNYLYVTTDAAKAKNPDYRIELKPAN